IKCNELSCRRKPSMRLFGIIICSFAVIIYMTSVSYAQPDFSVSAENAILIEQCTGEVLYEKKAHEQKQIDSITKIMTAIIAIESGQMHEEARSEERRVGKECKNREGARR